MLHKNRIDIFNSSSNVNIDAVSKQYDSVCLLDSNVGSNSSQSYVYDKLIAIGSVRKLVVNEMGSGLQELQRFIDEKNSWLFGYLSYDLKNEIEHLSSSNQDGLSFPLICFFEPQFVVEFYTDHVLINCDDEHADKVNELCSILFSQNPNKKTSPVSLPIKSRVSKEEYLGDITSLKKHIQFGDIYEINYCQEFYAEEVNIDPVFVYEKLNAISSAPFASFLKFENNYLMSSSPERFIKKTGTKLISQPIKGTAKRSSNMEEDNTIKDRLANDLKEQNENVMIVDLVRNDLSKLASKGSVKVEELFGVHTFKQVHQLISTVSCELKPNLKFTDIIRATFPMGSMTGAPKVSAMHLIEKYEKTKRGLYSGCLGYIQPDGDFDFNVVIRTILYNSKNKFLSFMVGSAITDKALPEKEYEECLLKANALFQVLKNELSN